MSGIVCLVCVVHFVRDIMCVACLVGDFVSVCHS